MAAAALAVRLFFMWHWQSWKLPAGMDHFMFGWERGRIARSIVEGHGFSSPFGGDTGPSAWSAPLFPYLIAAVFRIWGVYTAASAAVMIGLQILASALTGLSAFFVARRAFGDRVALWTGWAWVFFPPAIEYSTTAISEASFSALGLCVLLLLAFRAEEDPRLSNWIGLGLFGGLAALFIPEWLAVLACLTVWLCLRYRSRGIRWFVPAATAAALAVLLLTPWLVRNYEVFGKFVPIRSNVGVELYVGNAEGATGLSIKWLHPSNSLYELDAYRRMGELAYSADRERQALHFIAQKPGTFAGLCATRFLSWWFGWWHTEFLGWLSGQFGVQYHFVFYLLLSLVAFPGFRSCWRQKNPARIPFLIVLVVFPLPYYVLHVNNRYRHPLDPLLLILAVAALVPLFYGAPEDPAVSRSQEQRLATD